MQKKLIALAIAGLASGAAFAADNVTIYGVADMSFESVSATGSSAGPGGDLGSRSRVSSNSSYIGFKGAESIGNGLTAVFQIENGLSLDNSAAGVWNNRDSYIGLAGSFGTIVAGNVTGPTRALGAKFDVNAGATGIGANTALLGKGLLQGTGASAFDQRITNAIAYITPNFTGFQGVVGYSTGLTNTVGGVNLAGQENSGYNATGSVKGNTAWTVGLNYENGPFYVGYAYTVVNTSNNGVLAVDGLLGALQKAQDNRLGVMWNFGQGTVGLLWDQPKYTTAGVGVGFSTNVYYIPFTFNIGAGKLLAQYGRAGDVTNIMNSGAKHYEIGYEYSLSKRTSVRALYSRVSNDTNAQYDFLYGVAANNTTATGLWNVGPGSSPSGLAVGMRHTF